jgi:PKD repeat protein
VKRWTAWRWLVKVALLVVTALLILLVEGSADPTAIVTVANGSAAPGRPTNVRLSIVGAPEAGLSDLQGNLTYDPQVVHVESLKGLNDYQVYAYKVDNDLGKVRFIVVKVTGKFLREGDILQFTMRAVGKVGDTSLLELTLEALNDPNGKPIAHRVMNGTFTIKAQQAAFTFRPTEPRVNETVQFIDQSVGNIVRWLWDFGDGTGSSEQNPTHKYSTAGTYTVKLLVEDSAGATDIGLEEIIVRPPNRPPQADFTFSPANPAVTDTIQFNDRSTDPDGDETIVSWSWDFGDGTTSTAQNPTHTYSKAGTYTVKLKVTDNEGASDTTSKKVIVGGAGLPQADFSFSPENPKPGETVQFSDQSIDPDGEIVAWAWDFGDGRTSSEQNPSHKYAKRGTYTVRLTVTDNDGLTGTATKEITVGKPQPTVSVHCYPNPASSQTTFKYSLPQGTARANLYIFDVTGRLVFAKELSITAQEYTWDLKSSAGVDLPSGPYFYYIIAFDAAGKMIAKSDIGKLVIQR